MENLKQKEKQTEEKLLTFKELADELDKEEAFEQLDLLWEAFLYSPQADVTEDRIDIHKFINLLRKIINSF